MLLLHIKREAAAVTWVRCLKHVPPGGIPVVDPGYAGEIKLEEIAGERDILLGLLPCKN